MKRASTQMSRATATGCGFVPSFLASLACLAGAANAAEVKAILRDYRLIDDLKIEVATNPNIPRREAAEVLLADLKYVTAIPHRPIVDPVEVVRTGVLRKPNGEIDERVIMDRDRVLDLIIWSFLHISGEKNAAALLQDTLKNEPNRETREVIQIALGLGGDPSGWCDVVSVLRQKGRTKIRAWAGAALGLSKAKLAIPDLLDALQDPDIVMRVYDGCLSWAIKKPVYEIRSVACGALDRLGVKVKPLDEMAKEFVVDRGSAVRVLTPELQNKDKEHVKQAIEAIARVGGPAAKEELKRFVEEQERLPGTTEVVAKAKEVLARMETEKK